MLRKSVCLHSIISLLENQSYIFPGERALIGIIDINRGISPEFPSLWPETRVQVQGRLLAGSGLRNIPPPPPGVRRYSGDHDETTAGPRTLNFVLIVL